MPRLAPKPLSLEDDEEKELNKILARYSTSQQIAKRAKIIVFHYTPKHCSWLNQIEIWLSIVARKLLKRSSFRKFRRLSSQDSRFHCIL